MIFVRFLVVISGPGASVKIRAFRVLLTVVDRAEQEIVSDRNSEQGNVRKREQPLQSSSGRLGRHEESKFPSVLAQGTLPPHWLANLSRGIPPLALLGIARCPLKESTYTDLNNELANFITHKKASGPMLISERSSVDQSRCFRNLALFYPPCATGGNNKWKKTINKKSFSRKSVSP